MLKKSLVITDLAICSVWLLLLAHGLMGGAGNPFFLFLLALRIWAAFLMQRGSKLMLAPIAMILLVGALVFIGNPRRPDYFLFVEPWVEFLTSVAALFLDGTSSNPADIATEISSYSLVFKLLGCVWLFVLPWCVYIWRLCRKQLHPSSFGAWKAAGLCAYIFAIALFGTILLSATRNLTIAVPVVVLMLLLVPVIFNRGRARQRLSRGEKAYLAALAIIFVAGYVYDIIRHKIVSNERVEDIITSDSTAVRMPGVQDTASELTGLDSGREDGDVCVSQDGRVTIESGVIPGGGSAPDYWARWTVIDSAGTERVIELPDAPYQYAVNAITKKDGTAYYIVSCYAGLGGVYVEEWLEAYRIAGDGIQQVNVADGGQNIDNSAFALIYSSRDWDDATGGNGYDWILEYDGPGGDIYVPVTTEDGGPAGRCVVWHFDGDRFVRRGERPHRGLHESLAAYNRLVSYDGTGDCIVRVDSLDSGDLRYASWKSPKTMADEPDTLIMGWRRDAGDAGPRP